MFNEDLRYNRAWRERKGARHERQPAPDGPVVAAGLFVVAALVWLFRPPGGGARVRGCAGPPAAWRSSWAWPGSAWAWRAEREIPDSDRAGRPWPSSRCDPGSTVAQGAERPTERDVFAALADLSGAEMLSGYGLILGRVLSSGRRGGRRRAISTLIRFPYSRSREACLEFVAAFGGPGGLGRLVRLPRTRTS